MRSKEGEITVKATGIVRRVDELDASSCPWSCGRTLDISERDPLEIYVDGASIVLRKFRPNCIFCNSSPGRIGVSGEERVSEVPERASVRHILTPCTAHGEEGPPSGGPSFL